MTQVQTEWCEKWCEEHASSWQVLNRVKWKYAFRARTLVRFVEEVNLREDEVTVLLDYLASDDCIATLQLYDQSIGAEWAPIRAWLELSNKSHGNIHAVRLYHALQTEDGEHSEMFFVEDGCASKVWLEYHWNEPSVIQPIPASESGISYHITGISRDPDTGLYSYVIEKRERVQQDLGPYVSRETVYERTTVESHHGVKADMVDSTGPAAGVSDGTITTRSLSKNADCTTDVSTQSVKDKPVDEASKQTSVTLRGKSVTIVNRNQGGPADDSTLGIGEGVTNEKTDSGLWNQTIRTFVRNALYWLRGTCRKTIYEHSHSETVNQGEDPGFTHTVEAEGGVIVTKSVSATEDGTFDVRTDTDTEIPVSASTRTVRKTLNGTVVREESRNQPVPLDESGLRLGDSVTNSKTPGGLYNTVKELAPTDGAGLVSDRCHQDNFTHHHTTVENKGADAPDVSEHSFEDGVIVDKSVSLQSNGTKDVSVSTTTPKPWKQSYDWWSGDTHHFVVKYGNQPEEFAGTEVPRDASSVNKNDNINAFNLHDGNVSWSYGPWKTSVGDLKFIKHGVPQKFYMSYRKPFDRCRYHRVKTIETVYIRGDAYTDFLSSLIAADANRTQEGVLAVKLIEKYKDKDGNLLAEWVELRGFISAEQRCTTDCTHGKIDDDATGAAIGLILDNFVSGSATSTSGNTSAEALRGLESAIVTQGLAGSNTYSFKQSEWHGSLGSAKAAAK